MHHRKGFYFCAWIFFLTRDSFHHSYVSCVLGCPYEGSVAPEKVAHVSPRLINAYRPSSNTVVHVKTAGFVPHLAGCQASLLHGLL